MSFGNRGAPSPKRESSNDGEEFWRETRQVATVSKGSSSTLYLIAGAFAVAAIGYLGLGSMKSMFAARPSSHSAAGAAGGDGLFSAPLDSDGTIKARVFAACMPKRGEDLFEDWPGMIWAADEFDRKTRMSLTDAPEYLSCASRTERQRFCKRSFQEEYANQVTRYLGKVANTGFGNPMMGPLGMNIANIHGQMMKAVDDMNKGQASSSMKKLRLGGGKLTRDSRIDVALRSLSRDGLLSKSNFGWFGLTLPNEIAPFLEPSKRKVCP